MKKLVLILVAFFVLIAGIITVSAFQPKEWMLVTSAQTGDANALISGSGYLYGFSVNTDGSNAVTFQVYDSLTTGSNQIGPNIVCTSSSSSKHCAYSWDPPVPFTTGISVDITSSDATPDYVFYYRMQ